MINKIWLYTKYQLLTKTTIAIIIFPIYGWLINILLKNSGQSVISSGNYLSFLFSVNGIGMLILTLLLMSLLIATDINAFIIMSALVRNNDYSMKARSLVWIALKSIRNFFTPGGFLVMIYVSLIFPIIGMGLTISPMKSFQIPNFITSVIYSTPLYAALYTLVLVILIYFSYRAIFTFHFVLLENMSVKAALKASFATTKKRKWNFLKRSVIGTLKFGLSLLAIVVLLTVIASIVPQLFIANKFQYHVALFMSYFTLIELITYAISIEVPLLIDRLTKVFYIYVTQDHSNHIIDKQVALIKSKMPKLKRNVFLTTLGAVAFLGIIIPFNFLSAIGYAADFHPQAIRDKRVLVIAHRAGGELGAENTTQGLKQAIKNHANYGEIDVQRTKDNQYIINHDDNFKRLTGNSKKPQDLTLKQIKQLKVQDSIHPNNKQPVATLDQMLQTADHKIGLFIELKGTSADEKMADDVVKMVKQHQMEKSVVLISLKYDLIKYIHKTYPKIKTGYLYFFAIGKPSNLVGDYLIMEEREASSEHIEQIHEAHKKAIVWTVDSQEGMDKYLNTDIDGIITDKVRLLNSQQKAMSKRSDFQIILDQIVNLEEN